MAQLFKTFLYKEKFADECDEKGNDSPGIRLRSERKSAHCHGKQIKYGFEQKDEK